MAIELYNDGNHKCIAYEDLVVCDKEREAAAAGSRQVNSCESVQSNQSLTAMDSEAKAVSPR